MSRKPKQHADRALCPRNAAKVLRLSLGEVARAMRAADVREPLSAAQADRWKQESAAAPEWFTGLLALRAARDAATAERSRLNEIKRQAAAAEGALAAAERSRLDAALGALAAADPDLASGVPADLVRQLKRKLVRATGCSAADATAAAWRRWPPEARRAWPVPPRQAPEYTVTYRPAGTQETREVAVSAPGPLACFRLVRESRKPGEPPLLAAGDVVISVRGKNGEWPAHLSVPALRARGWSPSMIRDLLGEHDDEKKNPRYATAAPMKMYRASRVVAAEDLPEFAALAAKGARQSAGGTAAADRRRARKAAEIVLGAEIDAIVVPDLPETWPENRALNRARTRWGLT